MTTDGSSPRRHVVTLTAGAVSLATGAAVAWAAAHPVHTAVAPRSVAPTVDLQAIRQTTRQIAAARAALERVRTGLAAVVAAEDRLPRAHVAAVPGLTTTTTSSSAASVVEVPAASAPVPAPVAAAAPPPTQATTGASGAH